MKPEPGDNHRPAVFVVARMGRPLYLRRKINAAPELRVVIRLNNVFASVGQPAIAQQKAISTQRKIKLMPTRNSIGDEGNPQLVIRPPPTIRPPVPANLDGLVHLSVCKAFILAFIPAQPSKHADCLADLLLRIQAKAILDAALLAVGRDVRLLIGPGKKCLHRLVDSCPCLRD